MSLRIKNRRTATVPVILDGQAAEEYAAAVKELQTLAREEKGGLHNDNRLSGSPLTAARDRVKQLQEQVKEDTVEFHIEAIPRDKWDSLVGSHPPEHDSEKGVGYKIVPVTDNAVKIGLVKVTDHNGKELNFKATEWDDFASDLSSAQYDAFALAVFELNRQASKVMDLHEAAWLKTQLSEES